MNNTHKTIALCIVTMCALSSGSLCAYDEDNLSQSKDTRGLWKLGKCIATWIATGAVVGLYSEYASNLKLDNIVKTENAAFALSLTGFFAGIDFIGDKDVKSVTKETMLRVPAIMLTQSLASSEKLHELLRDYSPVLQNVITCKGSSDHGSRECAIKAATLGTLFYIAAVRPGLDKLWNGVKKHL